jgi:hypothetical protein
MKERNCDCDFTVSPTQAIMSCILPLQPGEVDAFINGLYMSFA